MAQKPENTNVEAVETLGQEPSITTEPPQESDNSATQHEKNINIHEVLGHFLSTLLLDPDHAQRINAGNNGVIFRLSLDQEFLSTLDKDHSLDEVIGKDVAAKILKLYNDAELGRREYAAQQEAWCIVSEAKEAEATADPSILTEEKRSYYADVPKPLLYHNLQISSELSERLSTMHVTTQGRAEVLLMDYVEGKDIATILYSELLQKHPKAEHFRHEHIENWNIDDLSEEVSRIFYYVPKSNRQDTDSQAAAERLRKQNADILIHELARVGVTIDPHIIKQLENTIRLFNQKGLLLRDAHPRNFMITGSLSKGGTCTIVDYGDAFVLKRPVEDGDFTDGSAWFERMENIVYLLRRINEESCAFEKKREGYSTDPKTQRINSVLRARMFFSRNNETALGLRKTQSKKPEDNKVPFVSRAIDNAIAELANEHVFDVKKMIASFKNKDGKPITLASTQKNTPRNRMIDANALLNGILAKLYDATVREIINEDDLHTAVNALAQNVIFSDVIHDTKELRYWSSTGFGNELVQLLVSAATQERLDGVQ